jgi:hypothetical protein
VFRDPGIGEDNIKIKIARNRVKMWKSYKYTNMFQKYVTDVFTDLGIGEDNIKIEL